jgi:hypothetical protein
MRPRPPTRYHDTHCDHTVSLRRSCSMSLYRSVAASVGATLLSSPARTGSRSCRRYGTCVSSEKRTDVWPVTVFGPVSSGTRRDGVSGKGICSRSVMRDEAYPPSSRNSEIRVQYCPGMPWARHAHRCTLSGCLLCHARSTGNRSVNRSSGHHGVSKAKKIHTVMKPVAYIITSKKTFSPSRERDLLNVAAKPKYKEYRFP